LKPCNAATYREATRKLAASVNPKVLVEVGVYAGDLSKLFATIPSIQAQYIVDSWEGNYSNFGQKHMDGIAQGVIDWAKTKPHVTVYRTRSLDGAALFPDESIDFFHTDGDHSLEGIMKMQADYLKEL